MAKTPAQLDYEITNALVSATVEDALDAFWRVVARKHPTATTGDLSPGAEHSLQQAARAAVHAWVKENVPTKFR